MNKLVHKHTPGPWENAGLNSKGNYVIHQAGIQQPYCIADVASTIRDEKGLANAELIAAAPELLAVLEEMTSEFKKFALASSLDKEVISTAENLINRLNSAIASNLAKIQE